MRGSPRAELIVFDCDGVLVDSERLSVDVDRRVLAEFGWDLSVEEIVHRFVGRSGAHFRSEIETYLGRALPSDWEAPYERWYADAFERHLEAVPGVLTAIDAIPMPSCVASSGSHTKIRTTLGLTGLLPRFDGRIFSAEDVDEGKPSPDLFLHAASTMGVDPAGCIVIEDSRFGVQAARAAGMRVLGYAGGLTPPDWLSDANAVFMDMAELPALVASIQKS